MASAASSNPVAAQVVPGIFARQLLYVLLSNPGIVFSREALLRKVWKDDTFVTVRSVDTLVKRVRKKIEDDPAEPSVILTVWGAGYKAADV